MVNKTAAFVCAILFILLINGCTYPNKEYTYHQLNPYTGWQTDDTIKFELDICDTINPLKMDIIGHITIDSYLNSIQGYPVNITFHTPCKKVYTDSVTLWVNTDNKTQMIRNGLSSIEILWNYRNNIINRNPGKWSIEFTKAWQDSIDYKNIIGLGICVTKYER